MLRKISATIKICRPLRTSNALGFASKKPLERMNEKQVFEAMKSRYRKTAALNNIVEGLLYPDMGREAQEALINVRLEEKKTQEGESKPQLEYKDLDDVERLDSRMKNVRNNISIPASDKEFSIMIKTTELNEILLKNFLKFKEFCLAPQAIELLRRLKRNLVLDKDIRARTLEQYKRKREYLKRINKNIDLKFPATFLTKEMVLNHEGFIALREWCAEMIENKSADVVESVDICVEMLRLTGSVPLKLTEALSERFLVQQLESHSEEELVKYLEYLSHYREIKIKNAIQLVKALCAHLAERDITGISASKLFTVIKSLAKIKVCPHNALCFKLEPHFLKFLKEYKVSEVVDLMCAYISLRRGSIDFLQLLIYQSLKLVPQMNLFDTTKLLIKLSDNLKRKDCQFDIKALVAALSKRSIFLLTENKTSLLQTSLLVKSFIKFRIGNKNYFEFLAAEFIKKIENLDLKSNIESFTDMYHSFALSGTHSKSLIYLVVPKLSAYLQDPEISSTARVLISGTKETIKSVTEGQNKSVLKEGASVYGKLALKSLTVHVKLLWSYLYFALKENYEKDVDFDTVNRMIILINSQISNLAQFEGSFKLSRAFFELMSQVNAYVESHGFKLISQRIDLATLGKLKLNYFVEYPRPLTKETRVFLREKEFFELKYRNHVSKYAPFKGYPINYIVTNKEDGKQTYLFINDLYDYLDPSSGSQEKNEIETGNLFFRRHILESMRLPYIELSYKEIARSNPNPKSGSSIETILSGILPKVNLEDEPADIVQELEKLLSDIKTLRTQQGLETVDYLQNKQESLAEKGEKEPQAPEDDGDISFYEESDDDEYKEK